MNIYLNLKTKELNFLSPDEVRRDDVTMASLSGYITLISVNDVKYFPSVDMELDDEGNIVQRNKLEIQSLLKNGYEVLNEDIQGLISDNYRICPFCGEDIIGDEVAKTVVVDAGFSLANIATENTYPYKEISCRNCGKAIIDRYPIISDKDDRKQFLREQMLKRTPVYVKCNFIIDADTSAYVPVFIYMKHLTAFFDVNKDENGNSDLMTTLKYTSQKQIIKILKDKEMQRYFLRDKYDTEINMRFLPIRLGNYSNYSTETDFDKIIKYSEIEDNQTKLFELAVRS